MLTHASFVKKAESIFKETQRGRQAFLYYFDFAEFKFVNRRYGIEGGNAMLTAAEAYLGRLPEVVVFERLFSDQFAFIVITAEPRSDEEIIASYAAIAEGFLSEQRSKYPACNLKTCCGICQIRNGNILEAMDYANMAWRRAKKNKITSAVVFDVSMLKELLEHERIEHEVNIALQEDRFTFYLQPKVDVFTGEISGAEALARREDTDGSIVYPDNFLSVMEENGSVLELDRTILRKVCRHMAERLVKGLPVVPTSVNLSRIHVQVQDAAEYLHAIAQEYSITPELLEFELTETILLDEFTGAKKLFYQLRNYGYTVSIDDFGSGYAGVNLLQELDFDVLKLDRRFLRDEESVKTKNEALLPDILHSLRKLHIDSLCEGVETMEQCMYLSRIGCRYVQGYYFSKPVSPDQFYEIYEKLSGRYPLPQLGLIQEGAVKAEVMLESQYESAIHDPKNGVCFIDRKQKFKYWDEVAEKITGYSAEEIIGQSCKAVGLPIEENTWALYKTSYPHVDAETGLQYYKVNTEIVHKNGQLLPILLKIFPTKIGEEIIGTVEIFTCDDGADI